MAGVFPGGIYLPASLGFERPDFALFLGLISQIRKLAAYKPNVGIRGMFDRQKCYVLRVTSITLS